MGSSLGSESAAHEDLPASQRNRSFIDDLPTPLCVGTWAWGANESQSGAWVGDPQNTRAANSEAFKECVTPPPGSCAGTGPSHPACTFFDTAEVYSAGISERILGDCIKQLEGSPAGSQVEVKVATKFLPKPWLLRASNLERQLRASLDRLQLPAVDLYQVHGPAFSARSVEVWAHALARAHQAGLCKEVGVSNYNSDQVRRTVAVLSTYNIRLASNQIEYSLLHRLPESTGLIATCQSLNVKVLAYSPLAMGRLTGKYTGEQYLKDMPGNRKFGGCSWSELQRLLDTMKEIGEAHGGASQAQVALAWVVAKGCIPIFGAKNGRQAADNCGGYLVLTPSEVARLDDVSLSGHTSVWQGNTK